MEIFLYQPYFSKEVGWLTDIQGIRNGFEKVEKCPENVSEEIQKDIWSRTGDIPIDIIPEWKWVK